MKSWYPERSPYKGIYLDGHRLPLSPVIQRGSGWHIVKGFAGSELPANRTIGYRTEAAALAAIRYHQGREGKRDSRGGGSISAVNRSGTT